MKLEYSNYYSHPIDLHMNQCGLQDCAPGHSFGPLARNHFVIHYILDGQGIFTIDNKTYHLQNGEGFLICPDLLHYYEADTKNPWFYFWVGFHGVKAEQYLHQVGLSKESPIFTYTKDDRLKKCFMDMIDAMVGYTAGKELRMQGLLYTLLSELAENTHFNKGNSYQQGNLQKEYIQRALQYINAHYQNNISVVEIANQIGLDRSYFCRIFKKTLDISPHEYLILFRIDKACELLRSEKLSIADVSRSVGIQDPFSFSRIFHKVKGCSPREYRICIHHSFETE
jgi:AraC-like DNA-binding protein